MKSITEVQAYADRFTPLLAGQRCGRCGHPCLQPKMSLSYTSPKMRTNRLRASRSTTGRVLIRPGRAKFPFKTSGRDATIAAGHRLAPCGTRPHDMPIRRITPHLFPAHHPHPRHPFHLPALGTLPGTSPPHRRRFALPILGSSPHPSPAQTSPKFPLRIWLAKPTVYRGVHAATHTWPRLRYNAR